MRKQYTLELKAQIVIEILKEKMMGAQIASEYVGHPNFPAKDFHVDYLYGLK